MSDESAVSIRILSYNVRHAQGVVSLPSNARTARAIAAIAPSVAGLQEVWKFRSFDQPKLLAALTGLQGHFHETHTTLAGGIGNLVLSSGRTHGIELLSLGGRREARGCLLADVEVAGTRFVFGVTHLSLHRQTRSQQLELLAEELPRDVPLILVGDFNCLYGELDPLSRRLSFSADPPRTYPSVLPFRALDHVGLSEHWELLKLVAWPSFASDHLPLVADVRLRDQVPA
ncbi:MAG: endonuclease/exonuclease/phosphatase family protein [Coriobacteriia bacterium]|nr:endonuclease/exonuclease/phosphatase family protein [Coriobacteriia bacterium]